MHYEDMLSWLLFYTSLLDVRKTPQVDITDPGGIVRSQVVETADGTLRIALNASQSPRTQSSRFLNEYFGSGVQHIAFATDDIVATAARLKANGVETLRIPENYYDDLEARVDLAGERLKMLKANNILYDKDDERRISPALHPELQGPVLPRNRRAARLQRLWRHQRADPAQCAVAARGRTNGSGTVTKPLRIAVVGAGAIGRSAHRAHTEKPRL